MVHQRFPRFPLIPITLLIICVQLIPALPVVDKGVFVITGVKTCGGGQGYCVLGGECSVDKEFAPDRDNGHCDGLRKAFTPRAYFVCCEYVEQEGTGKSTTTTTTTARPSKPGEDSQEASKEQDDSASPESKESGSMESIEKVGVSSGSEETKLSDDTSLPVQGTTSSPASSNTEGGDAPSEDSVGHDHHHDSPVHELTTTGGIATATTEPSSIAPPEETVKEETTLRSADAGGSPSSGGSDSATATSATSLTTMTPVTIVTTEEAPTTEGVSLVSVTTIKEPAQAETPGSIGGEDAGSKPVNGVKNHVGLSQKPIRVDEPYTTISYSEKTEISVEESVSLHVKQCGVKLTSSRIDASRLASQAASGMSSSCWTGAIVRSPMAMSMQADPGSFICAGALIHPNVLLTTATCVSRLFSQDLKLFKVALGSNHLMHPVHGPTPDADYRDIKELVIHEEYVVDGHMRINDIALVMLSEGADMTKACTLCLPDADSDFRGRECIVTGYSHPSDSSAMESDGILHEAEQRIEYQPTCEMVLTNFTQHSFRTEKDLEGLLCASGKYSAEACFSPRDAGSPLACSENGIYILAGSFSSGFHCGTPEMPVLYTDISKQMNWVNKNLMKTVMVF